jgi:hypothetical protein
MKRKRIIYEYGAHNGTNLPHQDQKDGIAKGSSLKREKDYL